MADYPVPGTLAPSEGPSVVDVVSRVFEDPRSGSVVPVIGEEVTLDSPVEGMTRRSDCVPGEPIGSGDVVALVDDGPVLALALPSPLWRDLAVGDRGEDVQALQEVLVGLGYEVPVSGFYDWNMGQTVAKIWAGVGGAKDQTGFPSCNYSGLGFLVVRRFV
jgi:hypothetical protein